MWAGWRKGHTQSYTLDLQAAQANPNERAMGASQGV